MSFEFEKNRNNSFFHIFSRIFNRVANVFTDKMDLISENKHDFLIKATKSHLKISKSLRKRGSNLVKIGEKRIYGNSDKNFIRVANPECSYNYFR
jgi:hypothetical protein